MHPNAVAQVMDRTNAQAALGNARNVSPARTVAPAIVRPRRDETPINAAPPAIMSITPTIELVSSMAWIMIRS
jgi:hypothetical protein